MQLQLAHQFTDMVLHGARLHVEASGNLLEALGPSHGAADLQLSEG
jgi:hypothetical protein